jgi:hypothetical protein
MVHERLPSYDVVAHAADEPVFLFGPPNRLQGTVRLHNGGDEVVVLRQGRLVLDDDELVSLSRLRTVKLLPGTRVEAPVVFGFGRNTAPGTYRGQIELAGARHAALVQVTELAAVSVIPTLLVIESEPGGQVEKEIVVANNGNVDTRLDAYNALPLDDELLGCFVLRNAALAFSDREEGTLDELLGDVANATKAGFEAAGVAGLTLVGGGVTVAPGQARPISVQVDVPEHLRHGTRYLGSMPVGTGYLRLLIVTHHRPGAERASLATASTRERQPGAATGTQRARRPAKKAVGATKRVAATKSTGK